jgi:hypothetical protein
MPRILARRNLPPLEAFSLGVAVIYSDRPGSEIKYDPRALQFPISAIWNSTDARLLPPLDAWPSLSATQRVSRGPYYRLFHAPYYRRILTMTLCAVVFDCRVRDRHDHKAQTLWPSFSEPWTRQRPGPFPCRWSSYFEMSGLNCRPFLDTHRLTQRFGIQGASALATITNGQH